MRHPKKVTICPRCYASNYTIANQTASFITGNSPLYTCKECGYQGTIFPEADVNKIIKLKKEGPVPKTKKQQPDRTKKQKKPTLAILISILFLTFLIYSAYRFGMFDFFESPHEHALKWIAKYTH